MSHVPLVHATRGHDGAETVECIHYGSVAVVDPSGRLLAHAGDPDFGTFTRSTIKPFQALPFMRGGGPARYGFGAPQLALLCASHSGEAVHVEGVSRMLQAAGCDERRLQCGCHVPLRFAATDTAPAAGQTFGPLEHNCSGKHAGFLAHCAQHGLPLDTYLAPDHPLQDAVRTVLTQVCDTPIETLRMGIDGCSAPNYALPLRRLAQGYARLARGADDATDEAGAMHGQELAALRDAMVAHPELVSGTGRNDLALMRAAPGDWVAKVGADGVQVIGVRSAGLGVAVKIVDGNARAACVAAIETLRQLGVLGHAAENDGPLASWAAPVIRNPRGIVTGRVHAAFALQGARP